MINTNYGLAGNILGSYNDEEEEGGGRREGAHVCRAGRFVNDLSEWCS